MKTYLAALAAVLISGATMAQTTSGTMSNGSSMSNGSAMSSGSSMSNGSAMSGGSAMSQDKDKKDMKDKKTPKKKTDSSMSGGTKAKPNNMSGDGDSGEMDKPH
ncbi:MAG: hypothetical protein JO261_10090 [Alphaproteobacteria bacterium]|nr:hypothetical protein [Alphaproteobacteria bacterium]MBV9694038.1 hypothetical protein [Alphaproteobacteria bacterium]